MYMYDRHIDGIPAALKTARRAERTERDESEEIVRVHPAHDYEPAQAWAVVKDAGGTLWIHHDQTDELLQQLLPPEDAEPGDAELGEEVATLYKVNPNMQSNNVRANRRIHASVVARIETAM